jgi:hypothetical protein
LIDCLGRERELEVDGLSALADAYVVDAASTDICVAFGAEHCIQNLYRGILMRF